MSGPLAHDAHERFCEEYLLDLNATAAYQRTYPKASRDSAMTGGSALMSNPEVQSRIAELQAERNARVKVKLDDVLRELMVIAFSDPRHFDVNELGHLILAHGAPDHAWRAVSSVKHRIIDNGDFTTREIEYRLWNKNDALKQLRDHIGQAGDAEDTDVIPFTVMRRAIALAEARREAAKAPKEASA